MSQYYAIILEFTQRELRLGLAGEAQAHVRLTPDSPEWKDADPPESSTCFPEYLQLDSHSLTSDTRDVLLQSVQRNQPNLPQFARDRDLRRWADWSADGFAALSRLTRTLLVQRLLVSPSEVKLFVLDGGLCALDKYALCETMMSDRAAVSVTFLPHSPCCSVAAGVEDALVVSLGWLRCRVVAILDLRCVSQTETRRFSEQSLLYGEQECDSEDLRGLCLEIASQLRNLPSDTRPKVARNVLFVGLENPAFVNKIIESLQAAFPKYGVSAKVCLGAWAGASLYCSTSLLKQNTAKWRHMEISKRSLESTARTELETMYC